MLQPPRETVAAHEHHAEHCDNHHHEQDQVTAGTATAAPGHGRHLRSSKDTSTTTDTDAPTMASYSVVATKPFTHVELGFPPTASSALAPTSAFASSSSPSPSPSSSTPPTGSLTTVINGVTYQVKRKVPVACDMCVRMKVKCTGFSPCDRCTKRGFECTFRPVAAPPPTTKKPRKSRRSGGKAHSSSSSSSSRRGGGGRGRSEYSDEDDEDDDVDVDEDGAVHDGDADYVGSGRIGVSPRAMGSARNKHRYQNLGMGKSAWVGDASLAYPSFGGAMPHPSAVAAPPPYPYAHMHSSAATASATGMPWTPYTYAAPHQMTHAHHTTTAQAPHHHHHPHHVHHHHMHAATHHSHATTTTTAATHHVPYGYPSLATTTASSSTSATAYPGFASTVAVTHSPLDGGMPTPAASAALASSTGSIPLRPNVASEFDNLLLTSSSSSGATPLPIPVSAADTLGVAGVASWFDFDLTS